MKRPRKRKTSRIVLIVLTLIAIGMFLLWLVANSGHEKLRVRLCASAKDQYPSWYILNSKQRTIYYTFTGYSNTTADVLIDGRMYYNFREATKQELKSRFIDNNIYFVYSDDEISRKQIESFKRDNFWREYESSGMTFKC